VAEEDEPVLFARERRLLRTRGRVHAPLEGRSLAHPNGCLLGRDRAQTGPCVGEHIIDSCDEASVSWSTYNPARVR